ncbi:hypothetical protein AB8Z76_12105 [Xanthomonas phaseoli pv. phaseoli]|uniref:hypothetical protein n=2 Tax=Xanthomonas phaseoli TaxID=1985254 RepID=UPI0009E8737A|nr:hypothetical protein [Xanthomonas phaseoli]ATS28842.1 hypothetical protein XppCFBP6546P_02310 [Xanthomonas phaseoli pv. phaseoli]QTK96898.1 hypothetical protein J6335_09255 [Xanthomonas phaseoli pv. phaseoli]
MTQVLMFLKVVTAPAWVPLWLMKKGIRLFAVLVLGAVLAGCATTSNKFDKSPCAWSVCRILCNRGLGYR